MTEKTSSAWRAQPPSADFAERTVAAILAERRAIRPVAGRRRGLGWVAIAAVLVAGGAWARTALPRPPRPRPSPAIVAPAATGAGAQRPTGGRVPAAPEASSPDPARSATPMAPSPSPRRRVEANPPPDARRKARLPRCNCQQTICDCGEEP
jgi:hypothetical protein